MNSWKARRPPAWELSRDVSTCLIAHDSGQQSNLPAVEDVHEGNGEDIGLLGAGKVGDVSVERDTLLGSTGLGDSQTDTENGVGTELGLVGGTVELEEELVDLALVLDVNLLLDERGANDLVDVLDGLENTLASPVGLVAVTELASLVLTYISPCLSDMASPRRGYLGKTNRWRHQMARWRGRGQSPRSRHRPRRWGCHESRRRNEREPW